MEQLNREIFTKLNILSSQINSAENLSCLLNHIMTSAKELIDCQAASLLLLDQRSEKLKFHITLGETISEVQKESIPMGTGIAGLVAQTGECIISNQAHQDKRFYNKIDEITHFKTESLLCVPMKVKDNIIGVIEAINAEKGSFTDNDKKLLTFLANVAAIAINNRTLFRRLKNANKELDRRVKELNYLYKLSLLTKKYQDVYDIFDSIFRGLSNLLKAKKTSLLLYDSAIDKIRIISAIGHPEKIIQSTLISPKEGITGYVFETQIPLLILNINDERALNQIREKGRDYESTSFISVPIVIEDDSIGVINMTDKLDNETFSSFDYQVLTNVASFIAKVYQNHKLKEIIAEQNRIKKEIEIATILQNSFLPKQLPSLQGLDIAVYKNFTSEVGGHFYDFIEIDEDKIAIALCRVSDRGIPAALSVALFKNMLRGEVRQNASPKTVINRINQQFFLDSTANMHIHALYCIIDIHNSVITYTCSGLGINFFLYKAKSNEIETLVNQNKPIGETLNAEYREYMKEYQKNDLLIFSTEEEEEKVFLNIPLLEKVLLDTNKTSSEQVLEKVKNHLTTNENTVNLYLLRTLLIIK